MKGKDLYFQLNESSFAFNHNSLANQHKYAIVSINPH